MIKYDLTIDYPKNGDGLGKLSIQGVFDSLAGA